LSQLLLYCLKCLVLIIFFYCLNLFFNFLCISPEEKPFDIYWILFIIDFSHFHSKCFEDKPWWLLIQSSNTFLFLKIISNFTFIIHRNMKGRNSSQQNVFFNVIVMVTTPASGKKLFYQIFAFAVFIISLLTLISDSFVVSFPVLLTFRGDACETWEGKT